MERTIIKIIKKILPNWIIEILRKAVILRKKSIYKNNKLTKTVSFIEGGLVNLYKGSFVDDKLIFTGSFEPNISRIMRSIVNTGDVCIDIGANIGLHTILLSKLVGDKGKVYAFEPVPYNIKKLNTNLSLSGCTNVNIVDKAVADSNGEMVINMVPEDGFDQGSSSLVMNEVLSEKGLLTLQSKVNTIKLEYFVEINQLENINFIKMDIEGFEYWALKGFGDKVLLEMKPKMIIEYNNHRIEFLGINNTNFKNLLEETYDCYEICKEDVIDHSFSLEPFYFNRSISADLLCIPKYKREE
jgi:FkbM family methyltransferase